MRVAIISIRDQAGSGYQFACALRSMGIDAMCFTRIKSKFGFLTDGDIEDNLGYIMSADVLHFKGDDLPGHGSFPEIFPEQYLRPDKPIVITVGGSRFRRMADHLPPETCLETWPIERYFNVTPFVTAITPDLCYPGYGIEWMPHACNDMYEEKKAFDKNRPAGRKIVIGHSPSNREKKGTDSVFLPMAEIFEESYNAEVLMIENIHHHMALRKKMNCDVFFDQAVLPSYGMSAVEAMSMGIPVVTRGNMDVIGRYISRDIDKIGINDFPVLFFGSPPVLMSPYLAVRWGIKNIEFLRKSTRQYFLNTHSYSAVAPKLYDLYSRAIEHWKTREYKVTKHLTSEPPRLTRNTRSQ